MNPTLKGIDQWPNVSSLPPSSPVEAVSSPERVETAGDEFLHSYRQPDGGVCLYSKQAMLDAFRAGYEAGKDDWK